MNTIILASKSPSRRKILGDLGYEFKVFPSDFDEFFDNRKTPEENAMILAEGKAKEVFQKFPENVVIGMDSIMIDPFGKLLEKPVDRNDAEQMMKNRSGKKEVLISSICILFKNQKFLSYESTEIFWQEFSDQKIQKILDTNEWKGKCGGIAIEGFTGLHIAKISGNYANVMGFPINEFLRGMAELTNN